MKFYVGKVRIDFIGGINLKRIRNGFTTVKTFQSFINITSITDFDKVWKRGVCEYVNNTF